jgi:hypothetical protein
LQVELDRLLEQTDHDISRLPNPPSAEPLAELLKLIGLFVRSVEQVITGAPEANGLMQALREPREEFKKKIRLTAPDFRPLERPNNTTNSLAMSVLPEPRFLSSEEQESEWQNVDPTRAIFVEDVMERANS